MFLPQDFTITTWDILEPYFQQLVNTPVDSVDSLKTWLLQRSELESIVSEDLAWRYIRMTCDTADEQREKAYLFFVSEIQPHIAPYEDKLNSKLNECPFTNELTTSDYSIYLRSVRKDIELFREENIPLFVELNTLQQQYGSIAGAMTVDIDGKTLTLQQAANYLKSPDRSIRKNAFELIQDRRLQDKDQLDTLLDQLVELRTRVARNAGFTNFRDYMHRALGRFDYSVEDCFRFHEAVAAEVMPLVREITAERKAALKTETLRPYDLDVDPEGREPLHPFTNGKELLEKAVACFAQLDPYFAQCLQTMDNMHHLDLDSRLNKAPGGYNYPLAETGVPFIFMNAAGNLRDVETMVHEGGHAVHSFLTQPLSLNAFKDCPSEVAELASMSMELLTMNAWNVYFTNLDDLMRAQMEQLEGVIKTLPWIATVDKFQHWLYENPGHTVTDRRAAWLRIAGEFSTDQVDWSGYEESRTYNWQKQLHIYEVPFYYIEYGFAQLGAIAVWRNYKMNGPVAIEQYKNALKLGYTRTVPEIYAEAGIRFDFFTCLCAGAVHVC